MHFKLPAHNEVMLTLLFVIFSEKLNSANKNNKTK